MKKQFKKLLTSNCLCTTCTGDATWQDCSWQDGNSFWMVYVLPNGIAVTWCTDL